MIVLLQVQRRMTFTEITKKKLTWHIQMSIRLMTVICNLSKFWWNPVYMHLFKIWSIWWSCLLMVLLYIAEMESIWCPLMYTMTASWSVLTHSFVHANKNKCKKKNYQEHLHPQSAELSGVINKWTCAPLTYCHPDRLPWSCTCPSDIWEAKKTNHSTTRFLSTAVSCHTVLQPT